MKSYPWPSVRLDQVGRIVTGNTPPPSDRSLYGSQYKFVTPVDLGTSMYVDTSAKMLSEKGFARSRHIPAGSTLFVCIGSTIGKTGLAKEMLTTNQQINSIIPNNLIDSEFLYYVATSLSSLVREQAGEQAVPLVNKSSFSGFEIPLPALAEQREIATFLKYIDKAIDALLSLIGKKRDIKQGVMQQLLTGRTRLPGFGGDVETVKLGEVSSMRSGGTPSRKSFSFFGGAIPWVSISDMTSRGKYVTETKENLSESGLNASAAILYPPNVVLYAMYASLGAVSLAVGSVSSSQAILGILPSEDLDREYLYYWLDFVRPEVVKMGQQGTQSNLNAGMVRNFDLRLPSIEEQRAIANVLKQSDKELSLLEQKLTKIKDIKQGMMQQLLTGRVRLPLDQEVKA